MVSRIALAEVHGESGSNVKDLADFDVDEQALIKKKRPWGWFAAGLVGVAALTFALGFALPLHRSHAKLKTEHETLAQKAAELDQALIKTKGTLKTTEKERSELDKTITTVQEARAKVSSRLEIASATAERQLKSLIKADLAEISQTTEAVEIALPNRIIFLPRRTRVNPRMRSTLCAAVKSLGQEKDWRLTVTVTLAEGEEDPWTQAGELAGSLTATLVDSCPIEPGRISAKVRQANDNSPSTTVLTLGPTQLPELPRKQK